MSESEIVGGVSEREDAILPHLGSEASDVSKDRKARFKALQTRAVSLCTWLMRT